MDDDTLRKSFKDIGDSITVGLNANRIEMTENLKAHRVEMQETLRTNRKETSEEIKDVRTEVGKVATSFNQHCIDAGRKEEQIDSRARSAHRRIDETNDRIDDMEGKKDAKIEKRSVKVWGLWGVIVAAVIAGVFALIVALLPEDKDEANEIGISDPVVVSE